MQAVVPADRYSNHYRSSRYKVVTAGSAYRLTRPPADGRNRYLLLAA